MIVQDSCSFRVRTCAKGSDGANAGLLPALPNFGRIMHLGGNMEKEIDVRHLPDWFWDIIARSEGDADKLVEILEPMKTSQLREFDRLFRFWRTLWLRHS
jgi:hypothetical protein